MPPQKSNTIKPPKSWPSNIRYLTTQTHTQILAPSHLDSLRTQPENSLSIPANTPRGPSPLVKITPISIPSHPAFKQCGLFAASDLKPGTFILQYIGEIHASPPSSTPHNPSPLQSLSAKTMSLPNPEPPIKPDPHATSNYDLSLDRFSNLGIDAGKAGNEARFVNDYRGISERPNAEFKEIWDERRKERGMGVFVLPVGKNGKGKGIKKGQEILVSYGKGFWGARREVEVEGRGGEGDRREGDS